MRGENEDEGAININVQFVIPFVGTGKIRDRGE